MPNLPAYNPGGLQPGLNNYVVTNVLAANTPESITVPTDATGKLANYVTFGKGTSADFFAQVFATGQGENRATNGTFAEYVTNGAFSSDTGWTKGTGWAIAAGVASATTASSDLSQTAAITLVEGYAYTITYTVTRSAGTVTPSIGGTAGTTRSSAATFSEVIVAGSTQILAFTGVGFTGTIDNVTVTAWALGTGWTTNGTAAVATGAISTALSQNANPAYPLVPGQAYYVTFTTTRDAGGVTVSIGGTAGTERTTAATFSEYIIAGSTQAITFTGNGFTGTIDNVLVTPAAVVPADATSGEGAEQNPTGYFLNGQAATISIVSAGTPTITASFYK